eukprot:9835010-Lingulodinium_polyedra.AAC.1
MSSIDELAEALSDLVLQDDPEVLSNQYKEVASDGQASMPREAFVGLVIDKGLRCTRRPTAEVAGLLFDEVQEDGVVSAE